MSGAESSSYPIESVQFKASGARYEIIVYQRGSDYYAAWYCRNCLIRVETGMRETTRDAKAVAQEAIGAHHLAKHLPSREAAN